MDCYINDQFFPYEKATLHISDLSIQRGYGLFDFFRLRNNKPLFLADHLERFYRSAAFMRLACPVSQEKLTTIIHELMERNQLPDSGIKVELTGGYSPDGYSLQSPNLIITQHLFKYPGPEIMEEGVKLISYPYRKEFAHIKSINYLAGIMAQELVQKANAFDALYQFDGVISELPRSNFFIVTREGVICTPAENVLPGIMRSQVLKLAATEFPVRETTVMMDDLNQASEAFFTSTTKRVVPVVRVDNQVIGSGKPGPVTSRLLQLLLKKEDELLSR